MRPNQVKLIAKQLGVTEQDVIYMNRWLGGDASLNAPRMAIPVSGKTSWSTRAPVRRRCSSRATS
jgi:hypothetical protein